MMAQTNQISVLFLSEQHGAQALRELEKFGSRWFILQYP
jgi:hypothetical protein